MNSQFSSLRFFTSNDFDITTIKKIFSNNKFISGSLKLALDENNKYKGHGYVKVKYIEDYLYFYNNTVLLNNIDVYFN
jgi:hypothetical protein